VTYKRELNNNDRYLLRLNGFASTHYISNHLLCKQIIDDRPFWSLLVESRMTRFRKAIKKSVLSFP